ncbi:putative BTB domain-containing protein [Seiridium unicorne]|uniref:BTB domain-containing protein n=1 Tax=Seiridium unicorne TaxID=138068 RepID=A0ABR2VEG5_9PEZI
MATLKRERSSSIADDDATLHVASRPRLGQAEGHEASASSSTEGCAPVHVEIAVDGDLVIIINETVSDQSQEIVPTKSQATAFTVRSSTVFAASKTLKAALLGHDSRKPISEENWTIQLYGDRPKPWATLFHIMHTHFKEVPSDSPDMVQIHHIALLADKYDLTHLLRPWARQWIEYLGKNYTIHQSVWCLHISWIFGDAELFKSMLNIIARRSTMSIKLVQSQANPYQINFGGMNLDDTGIPDFSVVIVGKLRLEKLKAILERLEESVDDLIHGVFRASAGIQCRSSDADIYTEDCNQKILATLLRSLAQAKLWPVPKAESVERSFVMTWLAVRKLTVVSEPKHKRLGCNSVFTDALEGWEKTLPRGTLTDAQLQHLKAQGEKTGLVRS